ncbi:MAG: alpha/beta fold hydrolase [Gammaproteobacteria bacterium]
MTLDLAFDESGDGPALIVVHGLYGSATNWRSLAKRFAERFRVIAVDLRNHGRSPWSDEMNYPAMADDLIRLMDKLGLERAHLLGHSMGGKAVMTLALNAPGRVDRLLVLDIAPVAYQHDLSDFIEAMLAIDITNAKGRSDIDGQLAESVPERAIRGFLLQNLRRDDEGGYCWRINLQALHDQMAHITGFPELHASFTGPSLFLHGDRSDYVRPEYEPGIQSLFPKASITTVVNAGHWLHAEQADAVHDRVIEFLTAQNPHE